MLIACDTDAVSVLSGNAFMSDELDHLFDELSAQYQPAGLMKAPTGTPAPTALDASPASVDAQHTGEHLYGQLGSIVRNFHESLRQLGLDKSINDAASSIAGANERINYIGTLTEEAANKVLNTLDEAIPAQEAFVTRTRAISQRWTALYDGTLSIEEFKALAADTRAYLTESEKEGEVAKARMLDIMMAQDFQDLTGQLIKKIVSVTSRVEGELAKLLKEHAPREIRERVEQVSDGELASGPSLPTHALVQDDVDTLLAGLGF